MAVYLKVVYFFGTPYIIQEYTTNPTYNIKHWKFEGAMEPEG